MQLQEYVWEGEWKKKTREEIEPSVIPLLKLGQYLLGDR